MNRHVRYLTSGLQHQRNGRLDQAERIYRRILREDGTNADALHLLGVVAHQLKDRKAAVEYIARAIQLQPSVPLFHSSLGNVLREMGLQDQALQCYRNAIAQKPDFPDAHVNIGSILQQRGEYDSAIPHYLAAIRSDPGCAEAYNNLANVWVAQGRIDDGIVLLAEAIRLKPGYAAARANLASALEMAGRHAEAIDRCREAIAMNPRLAPAHATLGTILFRQDRFAEAAAAAEEALRLDPELAEAYCTLSAVRLHEKDYPAAEALARRALNIRPDYAEALNNLGQACLDTNRLVEAQTHIELAVRIKPGYSGAWCNLGNVRKYMLDYEGAEECYRESIRRSPSDSALAEFNHALILLALGRFEEGWDKYEWRWRQKGIAPPAFPSPPWNGDELDGRTILVRTEQGLGDTIQFLRYATLLKQRGARVLLQCNPHLAPLLAGFDGADQVVSTAESPSTDLHAFLLSLPRLFRTRLDSIPGTCPYLRVDPALVRRWAEKLEDMRGLRAGISWAGNPGHPDDRRRSIPFSEIEPLLAIPGISWFSLQRGEAAWQLTCSKWNGVVRKFQSEPAITDTAAVVANLDVVVSVDTMIGHMAGALGKPVCLLVSAVPDWRWMLGRSDSPWYPTMELFRQPRLGDWRAVLPHVKKLLAKAAETRRE